MIQGCAGQACIYTLCVSAGYCYFPNLYIPGRDPLSTRLPHIRTYAYAYAYACPAAPPHILWKLFVEPQPRALFNTC